MINSVFHKESNRENCYHDHYDENQKCKSDLVSSWVTKINSWAGHRFFLSLVDVLTHGTADDKLTKEC